MSSDLAGSEVHFYFILEPVQGAPHTCLPPEALVVPEASWLQVERSGSPAASHRGCPGLG